MLKKEEIEEAAATYGISPIEVEKDYVYGWLLKSIFERPHLAEQLILKGGQAIRKAYLPTTRFSKDLDFSVTAELDKGLLEQELRATCAAITEATGVRFTEEIRMKDKDLPIPGIDAFEARLYFRGFYGEEKLNLRAQLDVTQFDKVLLPVQSRNLIHPYPDSDKCQANIRCQKLEEILASKLTAMLHRRRCGDLFDLLYSILISRHYEVSRREVVSTFLQKSIFSDDVENAKRQLLAIPVEKYEPEWTSLIVPSTVMVAFAFAAQNFRGLIESLFAVLAPIVGAGGLVSRRSRLFGIGAAAPRGGTSSDVFRSDVRNTILTAGRNLHLVDLSYDGYRRSVEPYKLQYYVRKKDNRGSEYFWGWDRTGGKSGQQGIKMFFCDKIDSVAETGQSYVPRFPVEM